MADRSFKRADDEADRSFVERNAASRRRLASIVERLRDSDLTLSTEEGGWTVAQVLGHLAFWDRSWLARWRAALEGARDGSTPLPVAISSEYLVAINPPLAALVGAWGDRIGAAVGAEAQAAAEAIDRLVEEMADSVPDSLIRERPDFVHRWRHREPHLDQLERAMAAVRPAAPSPDGSYVARNQASLSRLRARLTTLDPADLGLRVGDGAWTVGQVLGHLAFWDRFLAARWRAALAIGPAEQPASLPHELADLLNDGLPPTWEAFARGAGRAAVAETLAAAEAVDAIIAGLPEEAAISSILSERPALLDRSIHRAEHLEALETALGTNRG
jgi:uncharacterized damage-inducible protein DinB